MKRLIAVAGILSLASGMATAGDDASKEKGFEDVDQNQDGVITQAEAAAHQHLVATFNDADVNADGYLTPSEFDAIREETEEAE